MFLEAFAEHHAFLKDDRAAAVALVNKGVLKSGVELRRAQGDVGALLRVNDEGLLCLWHLARAEIGVTDYGQTVTMSIRECIRCALRPRRKRERATLRRIGLAFVASRQRVPRAGVLLVSNNHPAVLEIFEYEPAWAEGHHAVALRRLEGAEAWPHPVTF